jgi:hypothetical protein
VRLAGVFHSTPTIIIPLTIVAKGRIRVPIGENLHSFAGRLVQDWDSKKGIGDPSRVAPRIAVTWDDAEGGILTKLSEVLDDPAAPRLEALVIGAFHGDDSGTSSAPLVEALAAARDTLKSLRYLFLGDITYEENEMSWIVQCDVSPLFEAYPNLEHFTVRGSIELSLGSPRHEKLRELVVQSGGLPPAIIHEIAAAQLPALEHLELWLGDPGYGGDATIEDLATILKGDRWPRLKYLGLKNSHIQDEVAAAAAVAPVTSRLEVLDLSMGTLGDAGATALLGSAAVARLKKLDIHHHYVSEKLVDALRGLGIEIDASDAEGPGAAEDDRYVEVSE